MFTEITDVFTAKALMFSGALDSRFGMEILIFKENEKAPDIRGGESVVSVRNALKDGVLYLTTSKKVEP
ncbi:MAG: hypothetical protein K2H09_01890 [Treponemataceae bacterium]|nr:hypothetical protein [Treponemataceae bacterium]